MFESEYGSGAPIIPTGCTLPLPMKHTPIPTHTHTHKIDSGRRHKTGRPEQTKITRDTGKKLSHSRAVIIILSVFTFSILLSYFLYSRLF